MTENNFDAPVFVDVSSEQQYPIVHLFNQDEKAPNCSTQEETEVQETVTKPVKEDPGALESQATEPDSSNPVLKIQNRRLRCPECKRFTAENEEKLLRHIRKIHRGENPFHCYMCEYSTYNKSLFEEHVRIHQGIKPFKCSHCSYRSASKKNTKKHELIHRPDNPLRCPDCDYIARNTNTLNHHRKNHEECNNDDEKQCLYCLKRFTQLQFRKHRKKRFQCHICSYCSCSKQMLKDHLLLQHKEPVRSHKNLGKTIFQCSFCEWGSSSKPRILLHLIHHPNQVVNEELIDVSILRKHGIMT